MALMNTRLIPEVGKWYTHRDKGQMFQVVAIDDDDAVIETQDFDGDVDEIDLDTWFAMPLDAAEPPEDWTGPVDDVDAEDLDYATASEVPGRDWRAPIDELPAQPQESIEAEDIDDEDRAAP
jgi:hypothetical protein